MFFHRLAKLVLSDHWIFAPPGMRRDDLVGARDERLFQITQSYEPNKPLKTTYCKLCGGRKFYVGQGSYLTAIKCVKCKWELDIHNG